MSPPSDSPYDQLPPAYAAALRLRDLGTPDDEIARRLGVDVTAVPGLLAVAAAKLAHLDAQTADSSAGGVVRRQPLSGAPPASLGSADPKSGSRMSPEG